MNKHLGIQVRCTWTGAVGRAHFSGAGSIGLLFLPLKATDEEQFGGCLGYGGSFGLLRGSVLLPGWALLGKDTSILSVEDNGHHFVMRD